MESRVSVTGLEVRVWALILDGGDGEGCSRIKVLMAPGILQAHNSNAS